jgi:hypothetical protein
MIERHFERFLIQSNQDMVSSAEMHRKNLRLHQSQWQNIVSSDTCLCCLRRRPLYRLDCGHILCETCVIVFAQASPEDPWLFKFQQCFLCGETLPQEVAVRVHPPTAGVGVLCIDGGGVRGTLPLKLMKRLENRIGLPIPFQRFIKVAFGVSSGTCIFTTQTSYTNIPGGLIVADIFLNGWTIDRSTERFERLAKLVFQRRGVPNVPLLPRFLNRLIPQLADSFQPLPLLLRFSELLVSYFTDGLYPRQNIEEALKQAFGTARGILDISQATTTGTRVGFPVATVDEKPSCRIFTNYNGTGKRNDDQGT